MKDEDAAQARIKELEEQNRLYQEKLKRTSYELEDVSNTLRHYKCQAAEFEETLNRIKRPPLIHGYVTELEGSNLGPDELFVIRNNETLKVKTSISKEKLKYGQMVLLHPQSYAVVEATDKTVTETVAKVLEIDSENKRLIIDIDNEEKSIAMPKDLKDVEPGYVLHMIPNSDKIMHIMPSKTYNNLLLSEKPNVKFSQIGGLDNVVERINHVIGLPFKEKKLFKEIELEPAKGVILYGPPGCGKTLLAKAIATEYNMNFFNVSVADTLSKWVGESERFIKSLFHNARLNKPAIVFFDEIESLFTERGYMDTSGVHKNIVAQILAEMDGMIKLEDVYVLGATNRPDLMDRAFTRHGRFDEIIEVPRPNREGAGHIVDIYLKDSLHYQKGLTAKDAREHLLDKIYGKDNFIPIKSEDVGEIFNIEIPSIKREDVACGSLIKGIVDSAKLSYVTRVKGLPYKEQLKDGISIEDIDKAVEEECKEHAIVDVATVLKAMKDKKKRRMTGDPMVS